MAYGLFSTCRVDLSTCRVNSSTCRVDKSTSHVDFATSRVGTAIWCDTPDYRGNHREGGEKGNHANAWLHVALHDNRATYYAGFTWTAAGYHQNKEEWVEYVKKWYE